MNLDCKEEGISEAREAGGEGETYKPMMWGGSEGDHGVSSGGGVRSSATMETPTDAYFLRLHT